MTDPIAYVHSFLYLLDDFLPDPPLPPRTHIPRNPRRGWPAYQLDLDRAILLHDLGNTWDDI